VLQYRFCHEDRDHLVSCSVLGHRRSLVALPAELQHEHRRVGGFNRLARRRCRNRCLHAALSRSRLQRRHPQRRNAQLGRSARGHRERRRQTASSQNHDCGLHVVRVAAADVVLGERGRCDEENRRTHGGWHHHVFLDGTCGLSACLCHLEMELGSEASPEEKPSRLATQSGNRGSACLSRCLPVRSLPLQLLGYRLLALKQKRQPRRRCKRLTSSLPFTTFWIAQRTTFLPTRSSAWPMQPMTIVEVCDLVLPNRWSAASIRHIVRIYPMASLQRLDAWISCARH